MTIYEIQEKTKYYGADLIVSKLLNKCDNN